MAKYSAEFKCKVVQEYLNGHIGYTALTKKYGKLQVEIEQKYNQETLSIV